MIKLKIILLLALIPAFTVAQKSNNIIIITLDGMRWQEVFNGADTSLLNSKKFNTKDSTGLAKKYSASTPEERRKIVMPFLWNTVAQQGQIYGNRKYENYVNVKNRYWFSYPGYNEIFTGFPDTLVNSNEYQANPNENVLEFINKQRNYKNNVACFASWDAFKRILNEKRSGFLVNDGFNNLPANITSPILEMLNKSQHLLPDIYYGEERLDMVTGMMALEYMKLKHPKVLYISLGETDEWAHSGKYDYYLESAEHNDAMISMIWDLVQTDPFYKNNTTLLITTDHGRGLNDDWTSHYYSIPHSDEIWIAALGNNIAPKGELKTAGQLYQQQVAQTIAYLAGFQFKPAHPVAEKLSVFFQK